MKYRKSESVYIIAEIGINHNGDISVAKKLLKDAVSSGVDGVKIQVRNLESMYRAEILEDCTKAEQGTQYLLNELQKTHLTEEEVLDLFNYAKQFDVDFFASPFDLPSAELLINLDVPLFKIGSADFTNLPLLEKVASYNKPIILSTGMASEEEILTVCDFLNQSKSDFALLHCNSTYPASYETIHMKYISRLAEISGVDVGYSGHERGYYPTMAAVTLGAKIIERHITSSKEQSGPDHDSSLTVDEFKEMVSAIRILEQSLGKNEKVLNQGENINRTALAKSIVASKDLPVGHLLTAEDLITKSPARGISPLKLYQFLGKKLTAEIKKEEYIFDSHIIDIKLQEPSSYKIPKTWGIVGRLNDYSDFLDMNPDLIEIHMTWRDLFNYKRPTLTHTQDLVVHAPEYFQDKLVDFTTDSKDVTEYSIEMLKMTIEIARDMAPQFKGMTDSRGPRVVVHPGGHFHTELNYSKNEKYRLLMKNLKSIDTTGVRILVENMPPLPWYFGGQWHNTIFMDADEISQFAREMDWEICFDTSHAALFCNHAGIDFNKFTKKILNNIGYLHISDAKYATEEGLQIGKGTVDFESLFAILKNLNVGFVPEIWQGHLQNGKGFKKALHKLQHILQKVGGESCHTHSATQKQNIVKIDFTSPSNPVRIHAN